MVKDGIWKRDLRKRKEQKKFQELQEEALKRKAEFDAQLEKEDTGFDETTIEEMDEGKVEEVDTITEAKPVEETVEEKVEEPVKKEARKPLAPKPEYKSKFEDIAGGAKKEEVTVAKKRKKKDDGDRRVRAEDDRI